MSVSISVWEKFICLALFAIISLRGKTHSHVDEGCVVTSYSSSNRLSGVGWRGQQLQQGAPDFPFLGGKGKEVCDHIWFIGGVSECKWSELERAWYLSTGGTYQDSLCVRLPYARLINTDLFLLKHVLNFIHKRECRPCRLYECGKLTHIN